MAYENNNTNKRNINTYGPTYRQPNSEKPCALTVAYWNEVIRIQFVPELPKSQQTTNRRYDYEHGVFCTVTRSKAKLLASQYKEVLADAIKNNQQMSRSVSISTNGQLMIDTNVIDGEARPVLRFIQNIDSETLRSSVDDVLVYEFNRGEVIEDYNFTEGTFKGIIKPHFELEMFIDDLENFSEVMSMSYVHATKQADASFRDSILTKLDRIGEANGLNLNDKPNYSGNGGGGRGSIFTSNNSASTGSSTQEPVESQNIGSLDELDSIMNQ